MAEARRIFTALAATASAGLAMLAVILLATRLLSADEQGYFFALMSVGALVQIGDFGLSYAVLQKASHLGGDAGNAALQRGTRRLSIRTAGLSTLAASVFGAISIGPGHLAALDFPSLLAGSFALAALFASQAAAPLLSLREGSGQVAAAWRLRMLQEWAGGIACVATLLAGGGLYSLLALWAGRSAVILPLLVNAPPYATEAKATISWRDELWPFQWRIGLSNLSGFLIFRVMTLVVIAEQGAVEAGRYGFALAVMNMMLAVTTAWPNSSATRLGQLIAGGQPLLAVTEARRTRLRSTAFALASALCVWALFALATAHGLEIAQRMADPLTLALLLATGVVHHLVATQAVLLRAEIREPLLMISLIGGVANLAGGWLAAHFATPPAIAATALACALIGLVVSSQLLAAQHDKWKGTQCA